MDGGSTGDVINVRVCRTCGLLGGPNDFAVKSISKKTGKITLNPDCKKCRNEKQRVYTKTWYPGSRRSLINKQAVEGRRIKRQEIAAARLVAPTKFCSRCKQTKTRDAYHKRERSVDGLVLWCIECMSSYAKKYVTDPELNAARKEKYRIYRAKRTDDQKKAECEKVKARNRSDHASYMFKMVRDRAREKGLDFDLTVEWIRAKGNVCELSGIELIPRSGRNGRLGALSPSIDKIDSTSGYTQVNCRVICMALNTAFMHWGSQAFEPIAKAWLNRLANANVAA